MHISNDNFTKFKNSIRSFLFIVFFIGFILVVFSATYYFQNKNTIDNYHSSYHLLHIAMPNISLNAYKLITSIIFSLLLLIILLFRDRIDTNISNNTQAYKITFEKSSTKKTITSTFTTIILIANIVFSVLIGRYYYYNTNYDNILIFIILLCLLSSFFCIIGNFSELVLIHPLFAIIVYAFYFIFSTWFITLITPSVSQFIYKVIAIALIILIIPCFAISWFYDN